MFSRFILTGLSEFASMSNHSCMAMYWLDLGVMAMLAGGVNQLETTHERYPVSADQVDRSDVET